MGASSKRKKSKKQDFQKTKLKVGKAKPKAANFTNTSFKTKSIVVSDQFHEGAGLEDAIRLFKHNLSQAATTRSDRQRRDSLSSLAAHLSSNPVFNPVGVRSLLIGLLPLLTDTSGQVRAQLLAVLRALPATDVRPDAARAAVFIRAALTHLSSTIAADALLALDWLLDVAASELVAGPAGWLRTLSALCALLGWSATPNNGWSVPVRTALRPTDAATRTRQVATLSRLLKAGLHPEPKPVSDAVTFSQRGLTRRLEYWSALHKAPRQPQPFEYLNLYRAHHDEDSEMYPHRDARVAVFSSRFYSTVRAGIEREKREGGTLGRAAAGLEQILDKGLRDAENTEVVHLSQWADALGLSSS